MKSRASFFNQTVFRKDITRFAPAWLLYLIMALLISQNTLSNGNNYYNIGEGAQLLMDTLQNFAPVTMLYGLLASQLLFGDLFNSKLCNGLHALPLRRETWFCTHVVSGVLVFSLLPNLIVALAVIPYLDGMWYLSFLWLLGMTLEFLFFFGLGAFSSVCTGNRVAMTLVFFLLGYLSIIIQWFVVTFFQPLLYGVRLESPLYQYFSPACALTELMDLELCRFEHTPLNTYKDGVHMYQYTFLGLGRHWWYPVAMAGTGIVLLAAAVLLYRRRKLECAGDLAAFRPVGFGFLVVYTLFMGALGYYIGDNNPVFMIVGLLLGIISGMMMLERTVRILNGKNFLKMGIVLGALALSILMAWLDPFGIVEWTPKADQVVSISISDREDDSRDGLVITDPAQIERLIELHQQLVANRLEPDEVRQTYDGVLIVTNESTAASSIKMTYKMKSGRTVSRYYYYRIHTPLGQELTQYLSAPEYVLGYTDWQSFQGRVESALVNSCPIPEQNHEELLEAIKADCIAGTMTQDTRAHLHLDDASVQYIIEIILVNSGLERSNVSLSIYRDAENTMAWLGAHQDLLEKPVG